MPEVKIRITPELRAKLAAEVGAADGDADDSTGLVRRSFGITVKAVNKDARSVEVIASSEAIDAYDEIVVQDWDLKRYSANPVVLWNHNRSSYFGGDPEDYLPIGYSTNVGVVDGKLRATLNFVTEEANPLAEKIWQGFMQQSIRAVSVGFDPRTITAEKNDGVEYYKLADNELFEISVCPMGANPEAVVRSKAVNQIRSKMVSRAKTVADDLEKLEVATNPDPAPAPGASNKEENTMTTEEQKALETKNVELQAKLNLATEKSTKAEADHAVVTAKLAETEKALEVVKATLATVNDRCAVLETERGAQQKRADDLAQKAVEKELDALVGTKIAPTEKAGLVKLSLLDSALYAEQLTAIKSRPDMKMLEATIGVDPTPPPSTVVSAADDDGGKEIAAGIQKRIDATN